MSDVSIAPVRRSFQAELKDEPELRGFTSMPAMAASLPEWPWKLSTSVPLSSTSTRKCSCTAVKRSPPALAAHTVASNLFSPSSCEHLRCPCPVARSNRLI